jgi:serine/threonine protein kinase/tetratricopeptide (TPR) repeat protein
MRASSRCLSRPELEQFVLGRLDDARAVDCEEHVATCAACCQELSTITSSDAILREFQGAAAATAGLPTGPVVEELLRRVRRFGVGQDGDESRVAQADLSTHNVGGAAPGITGLTPTQEPGEIGWMGPYRVIRVLGQGGMGIVYEAQDSRLKRRVAIKAIREVRLLDAHFHTRFEREAESLARLRHPNIVQIFEAGVLAGRPYLALEYVDGTNLAELLSGRPQEVRATAQFVRTLAAAIHYAHEQGVVHRDIKPSNILVEAAGRTVRPEPGAPHSDAAGKRPVPASSDVPALLNPRITDFGLAKQLDDVELTQTGDLLGTPGYMAPELTRKQQSSDAGARLADLYSLGCILYEMLVGRPPFRGATALDTLEQARVLDPVSPRQLRPDVPRDLQTICLKCLEKTPTQRYGSAAELADDLDRFLGGDPILARPVTLWGQSIRWARRKPALATAASLLVVCFLAILIGAGFYERRLRLALTDAQVQSRRADDNFQTASEYGNRAEQNYRAARETIQAIVGEANDRRWRGVPRVQELNREQVERALAFYETIARQQPDNPQVRQDVASACLQAGKFQIQLGRREQGRDVLQRALELSQEILRDDPNNDAVRLLQADTLGTIGSYFGPAEQSVDFQERAIALLQEVATRPGSDDSMRAALAHGYCTLGATYYNLQLLADGERCLLQSVSLLDELIREQPGNDELLSSRAGARVNLCEVYRQRHQMGKARVQHDEAETDLERLLSNNPLDRNTIEGLAVLRINWSFEIAAAGNPDAAVSYVARNLPMLSEAMQREPEDAGLRDRTFRTYAVQSLFMQQAEHFREAAATWEQAIEFDAQDGRAEGHYHLAELWLLAGDYRRALAEADSVRQSLLDAENAELAARVETVYIDSAKLATKDGDLSPSELEELQRRCQSAAEAVHRSTQPRRPAERERSLSP